MTREAAGLTPEDQQLLQNLRHRRKSKRHDGAEPCLGDRVADGVAALVGSWRFILVQTTLLILWIVLNIIGWMKAWDPYPFILLNLLLSFQAAYTAPIIMMSQNRQADVDRQRAVQDYDINLKAELEIELLHQKIDMMREKEIVQLTKLVEELSAQLLKAKEA